MPDSIGLGDGLRGRDELRIGYPAIAVCALGMGSGASLYGYVSSLFMQPLQAEFGWSRAAISASLFVMPLAALSYPAIGLLIDRLGVRIIASLSALGLAAGYAAMTLSGPKIWTYYGAFLAAMVLGGATGPLAWTRVIAARFDAARGLALALVLCGGSVAAVIAPPLLGELITGAGWRAGLFALGGAAVLFGIPAALWSGRGERAAVNTLRTTGMAPREALATARFWILALCIFLTGVPVIGLASHVQPLFTDRGVTPTAAAAMVSLTAAGVILGRLVTGALIDRFWAPAVASAVLSVAAAGALLLALSGSNFALGAAGVLLLGMAQGAELDLLAYLASRYFGMRAYATLYGLLTIAFALALPTGAVSFGLVHDLTGDYRAALFGAAGCLIAAAVLFPALGPYPKHTQAC